MPRKQNGSQMLLSGPLSMIPSQLIPRFFPTSGSAPFLVCKNPGKCYQSAPHSCKVLLPYLKALLQVSQWEMRPQRLRWYQLPSQWSSRGQNFIYFKRYECHSTQMSWGHAQSPPPWKFPLSFFPLSFQVTASTILSSLLPHLILDFPQSLHSSTLKQLHSYQVTAPKCK